MIHFIKRVVTTQLIMFLIICPLLLISCSSDVTVCDCLKDDGTHKRECDRLGNSMTEEEMSREIRKCR
jgi:hypothetical protein